MTQRITDQQWGDYPCGELADDSNGTLDSATEARAKGWRGQDDWMDLSSYRQCGYMIGCVFLLIALLAMSACTAGLWIGEMWRK